MNILKLTLTIASALRSLNYLLLINEIILAINFNLKNKTLFCFKSILKFARIIYRDIKMICKRRLILNMMLLSENVKDC